MTCVLRNSSALAITLLLHVLFYNIVLSYKTDTFQLKRFKAAGQKYLLLFSFASVFLPTLFAFCWKVPHLSSSSLIKKVAEKVTRQNLPKQTMMMVQNQNLVINLAAFNREVLPPPLFVKRVHLLNLMSTGYERIREEIRVQSWICSYDVSHPLHLLYI